MAFFSSQNKEIPTESNRTILIIGGTGVLGKAFLSHRPHDVFIINVSRRGSIDGPMSHSIHEDILKEPEKLLRKMFVRVPMIDVLITMTYDHSFSSVKNLDRDTFLREIELDTFLPIRLSVLCEEIFWSRCERKTNIEMGRKVIHISSRAAFGKTVRPELASYSGAKAALNIMTEYVHEHLFSAVGVSAHIIAPGSLKNIQVMRATVEAIWKLERMRTSQFTVEKI